MPPESSDRTTPSGAANGAEPTAYVIPQELAIATLNYLAAQPYREVFTLVQAFESLEPHQPPD